MDRARQEQLIKALELTYSLNAAITEAGGIPLTIDDLKNRSIIDLILLISPNDVKFIYTREKEYIKPSKRQGE